MGTTHSDSAWCLLLKEHNNPDHLCQNIQQYACKFLIPIFHLTEEPPAWGQIQLNLPYVARTPHCILASPLALETSMYEVHGWSSFAVEKILKPRVCLETPIQNILQDADI